MTLQELNQYYRIIEKLKRAREALASLEESAGIGSPDLTGVPKTGSGDKVGWLAVEIADMRARVEYLEKEASAKSKEIIRYIQAIPDDQTRIIFRLRFIRGLSWCEVAAAVGGNTEDSVKKMCYRHLDT